MTSRNPEKLRLTLRAHIGVGNQGWAQGNQLYRGTRSVGNVLRTDGKNIRRSMAKCRWTGCCLYAACSVIDKEQLKADFFAGKKLTTRVSKPKRTKHAMIKLGDYNVPLIGIPPASTREKCDKCGKGFPMQDVEMGERILCPKCRKP